MPMSKGALFKNEVPSQKNKFYPFGAVCFDQQDSVGIHSHQQHQSLFRFDCAFRLTKAFVLLQGLRSRTSRFRPMSRSA